MKGSTPKQPCQKQAFLALKFCITMQQVPQMNNVDRYPLTINDLTLDPTSIGVRVHALRLQQMLDQEFSQFFMSVYLWTLFIYRSSMLTPICSMNQQINAASYIVLQTSDSFKFSIPTSNFRSSDHYFHPFYYYFRNLIYIASGELSECSWRMYSFGYLIEPFMSSFLAPHVLWNLP